MKKLYRFTAALVLLLLSAGCGSSSDPATSTDCVIGTSTIGDCKIQ